MKHNLIKNRISLRLFAVLMCLMVGLFFCVPAHASYGMFCTTDGDWYYHMAQNCQGEHRGYYQELEALEQMGKFPCPVCVPVEVPNAVMAVARGGTIVLRIPDAWMKAQTDIEGVFGFAVPGRYTGAKAEEMLAYYLHSWDYSKFINDYHINGSAEAPVFSPSISLGFDHARMRHEYLLLMNQRHIGEAWYVTFRPEKSFNDSIEIYMHFFTGTISTKEDCLYIDTPMEWIDSDYNLKFDPLSGQGEIFSREYENIRIGIFREMGCNIAVVYEFKGDKDFLQDVELRIEGGESISLNGYMDGTRAVYCCTLTDAEVNSLQNGAKAEINHKDWYKNEDFAGSEYAVVRKGTGGMGVINREGEFIIGPGYNSIVRYKNIVFCHKEYGGDIEMIDLDAMKTIAVLSAGVYHTSINSMNGAVFGGNYISGGAIYSMETGEVLWSFNTPADPDPVYNSYPERVDANYYCFEEGLPRRIAVMGRKATSSENGHEPVYWLSDNEGNRISDNYQMIEGLIWKEETGLFAVQCWSPEEHISYPNNDNKFLKGFEGRGFFGDGWRCGLMDQDGNIIADMEYTGIIVSSPDMLIMQHESEGFFTFIRQADGTFESFSIE